MVGNGFENEDEAPQEELSEKKVSDAPCLLAPEDQLEYWRKEFLTLVGKAKQDGISVLCMFAMVDPIEETSAYDYCCNGDLFTMIGLIETTKRKFLDNF